MENHYDKIKYITTDGKALDDSLNEFRDEEGCCIYIPESDWNLFEIIEN